MAHMLFDALSGVPLDNHTVQSILESTTLSSDIPNGAKLIAGAPTTITLDEEDVFQCGKCKKQFTSFSLFMCHKKEHTTGDLQNQGTDVSQDGGPTDSTGYQQLEVQPLSSNISAAELCQPIILSEADILSFNIDDESALNISTPAQASALSDVQEGNSFLATNPESANNVKTLEDATTRPETNSFSVSSLTGQPIILASQSQQDSYTSSALPGIQCITSQGKVITSPEVSSGKGIQNINILAAYPEKHPKGCKVLLPNIDYIEGSVENGTLLLECDKAAEKLLQYGNGSIDSDGAILLDYAESDPRKTCKVLLSNGECIEYISSAEGICEFPSIDESDANGSEVGQETISVSLLDVIEPSDGSPVSLELSKAIQDAVDAQISVHEDPLSVAIPGINHATVAGVTNSLASKLENSTGNTNSGSQQEEDKDGTPSSGPKPPKLRCQYCNKAFAKNFDLQQHLRSHTGEKPFQCVVCGRAFSQKSNVKKHMATHRVWPDGLSRTLPKEPLQRLEKRVSTDEEKKLRESCDEDSSSVIIIDRSYVCQYCNTSFTSYFELKTHMKKHSHQKVYKCVQHNCQKTFQDLDAFLKHTKTHAEEVQYCCHVCFKKFNTLADLGIHQNTHSFGSRPNVQKPRYFLCMKCKSKFTSSKTLEHHLSTTNHHFPCTHCGKVFTCERYLRRHLPTHGAPESYICPTCGKGFRTEQYLNTHRLIHSGVKPYACMHCPAAFNRKDKLVRHSLIHQAVKKFKCPFHNYLGCSKEFNRQDKLKLHILTHSAVKPFHCRKCNKMFHKQNLLREHERNHHSADAPFSCVRCGLRFKKKVHLSTHLCDCSEAAVTQSAIQEAVSENIFPETVSTKPVRGRRFRKIRSKPKPPTPLKDSGDKSTATVHPAEPTQFVVNHHSTPSSDNTGDGDNVPTIEIIVMPMPVNHRNENGEGKSVYHVMFPTSSSGDEIQTKSIQSNLNNVFNNSSKCVPEGHSDQTITTCIGGMDEQRVGM